MRSPYGKVPRALGRLHCSAMDGGIEMVVEGGFIQKETFFDGPRAAPIVAMTNPQIPPGPV